MKSLMNEINYYHEIFRIKYTIDFVLYCPSGHIKKILTKKPSADQRMAFNQVYGKLSFF